MGHAIVSGRAAPLLALSRVSLVALMSVVISGAGIGCSSSTTTGTSSGGNGNDAGGTDAAASEDGGNAEDAGADAAPLVVNGCKTFDDRSAASASRTIAWGFPLAASDRCVAIRAGQSVTWSGNFTQYRVAASAGSDSPNPIASFDPMSPTVTFPKAGTFGFESPDAPALVGAIRVNE